MQEHLYGPAYAEHYVLGTINSPYTQLKCAAIANVVTQRAGDNARSTVVDFGGNIHGTVKQGLRGAIEARNPGVTYLPLDLIPEYFDPDFLKKIDPNIETFDDPRGIIADARDTRLSSGFADSVIVADVLEHIENPDLVLDEAHRVLSDCGQLVVVQPSLYKLDIVKPTFETIREGIEGRRSTSHVNFMNHESLKKSLERAGFKIAGIEGLSFATGFPYLLWTIPSFVPGQVGSGVESDALSFKKVKEVIGSLGTDIHAGIDEIMNNPELGTRFIDLFTRDNSVHPLSMIYEVLRMHRDFSLEGSRTRVAYMTIKEIVDREKSRFDEKKMKLVLLTLLNNNPYQYLANSVLINARKIVA